MAHVVKTQYMDKATKGYSEYFFRDDDARLTISPMIGDRAIMKNGDVYFCWELGIWEKIGE